MKRKKFVSKWMRVNTLELVADRVKPIESQGTWLLERRLKQSEALASLMKGDANRAHISDLIAMHNMAVALQKYKTGDEYRDITNRSADAFVELTKRASKLGRYVATGPEITVLKELYELHDAQLEACTVGQVDEAYRYTIRCLTTARGSATKLPSKFQPEPP